MADIILLEAEGSDQSVLAVRNARDAALGVGLRLQGWLGWVCWFLGGQMSQARGHGGALDWQGQSRLHLALGKFGVEQQLGPAVPALVASG